MAGRARSICMASRQRRGPRPAPALAAERSRAVRRRAYVAAEARRNLSQKESDALETLEALLGRLEVAPFQSGNTLPDAARVLPEKDQPVLAAAICMRCAALVTGDRTHFSVLYGKTLAGVTIYSPRMLAEALLD